MDGSERMMYTKAEKHQLHAASKWAVVDALISGLPVSFHIPYKAFLPPMAFHFRGRLTSLLPLVISVIY